VHLPSSGIVTEKDCPTNIHCSGAFVYQYTLLWKVSIYLCVMCGGREGGNINGNITGLEIIPKCGWTICLKIITLIVLPFDTLN